jgi:hypothetical protein
MILVQGMRPFLLVYTLQVGPGTAIIGTAAIGSPSPAWFGGLTLLNELLDTGAAFLVGVPIALVMIIPGIPLLARSRVVG